MIGDVLTVPSSGRPEGVRILTTRGRRFASRGLRQMGRGSGAGGGAGSGGDPPEPGSSPSGPKPEGRKRLRPTEGQAGPKRARASGESPEIGRTSVTERAPRGPTRRAGGPAECVVGLGTRGRSYRGQPATNGGQRVLDVLAKTVPRGPGGATARRSYPRAMAGRGRLSHQGPLAFMNASGPSSPGRSAVWSRVPPT